MEDISGTELLGILCVVGIGKWDGPWDGMLVIQGVVLRGTNLQGITSGSPYTNSADDEWKSSLGVTLKPNRTMAGHQSNCLLIVELLMTISMSDGNAPPYKWLVGDKLLCDGSGSPANRLHPHQRANMN